MIDLAQADPTLRRRPSDNGAAFIRHRSWVQAMERAAAELGYAHWLDAPAESDDPTFIRLARSYHATAGA